MARPHKPTNEVLGTQITIRLNNDLFLQLNDIATAENRSLAGHIRMLIETEIARQQNILNKNYKLEFHEAG
jgi:predicted transcriptional regulator